MRTRVNKIEFECDSAVCSTVRHFDTLLDARGDGWVCGINGDFCSSVCRDMNASHDPNTLPFGLDDAARLAEPFCACGRVVSRCDRSRKGCSR